MASLNTAARVLSCQTTLSVCAGESSALLPNASCYSYFYSGSKRPNRHAATTKRSRMVVRAAAEDDEFEAKIARLQKKVTTGKKAEARKAKKDGLPDPSSNASNPSSSENYIMLPPRPLADPVSDGLPVLFGFTSYSERLHGKLAILGLAALFLVELGSGQGLLQFHDTPTLAIQLYTILSAIALFVKFELEGQSVWPSK